MALTISLENDKGKQIDAIYDIHDILYISILRSQQSGAELRPLPLLAMIDPYNDARFSLAQMPDLQSELLELRNFTKGTEEEQLLLSVLNMVEKCQMDQHDHIMTYGD